MLLHLRLNVPSDLVDEVLGILDHHECATNLTRVRDASLEPRGDLIEVDVAREITSDVLQSLEDAGLQESGGILLTTPFSTPFKAADEIEKAAPGAPEDAVVWSDVLEQAEDAVRWTVTFQIFLVLAVMLAAIAVITDSPILVVGAMVVGPEFGTVAAIAIGAVFGRWDLVGRAIGLLVVGFTIAILLTCLVAGVLALTPLLDSDMLGQPRPMTSFIWKPDAWSFLVAILAGAAGALGMSTNHGNAMVGVFISVTTVPAAGNLALALALWDPTEMGGSALQLGVNLLGMSLAGFAVIAVQRTVWDRALEFTDKAREMAPGARP